jgi:hypothetical protein
MQVPPGRFTCFSTKSEKPALPRWEPAPLVGCSIKQATSMGRAEPGARPERCCASAKKVWCVCTIRKRGKKSVIEWAYQAAEQAGIPLWCQDEAGPYQTIPYPGSDWHEAGKPKQQPHEYFRDGTAKLLTLFRPATGEVRAKGVEHAPNGGPMSGPSLVLACAYFWSGIIWQGISPMRWSAGPFSMASCPSTRRWMAPG